LFAGVMVAQQKIKDSSELNPSNSSPKSRLAMLKRSNPKPKSKRIQQVD
jgi:hypothetical protein